MNNMGVPINEFGYQDARTGNAYAGLYFSNEAIQTQLTETLRKDSIYYVQFFVNLSDSSTYAIWKIGAYLCEKPIKSFKEIINCKPQIINKKDNYITDKESWTKISGIYKAKGGEQYLIISSFSNHDLPEVIFLNKNKPRIRNYYIDDVSVIKVDSQYIPESDISNVIIEEGKIIQLDNIFFEFNKSELLPQSFTELDKLWKIMNDNITLQIEIIGHTDNSGDEVNNLRLSEARAKSVADYLISEGINKERIKIKGYGSSQPIAENKSEEGRMKNRRVEFKIFKK